MTVSCKRCKQTWPRDPALEVACPKCQQAVGKACRRPSGHQCDIHAERDELAMKMGFLQRCPATPPAPIQSQGDLFGGHQS